MESNGEHLGYITRLIEEGKVQPIVDSVYTIDEFEKAFERMKRELGGRLGRLF